VVLRRHLGAPRTDAATQAAGDRASR